MIKGRATPEGTKQFAARRSGYRVLGPTGLTVSTVGFGGYRVGRNDPTHRAALRAALAAGVNLIDTASNYGVGDSERLIGEVLAEHTLPREQVVVVSKVGYLQGPNLELAQEREAEGRPFPEMVKYMDGCWHCISPEFVEDQLTRALDRLGLETLDLLLLHNPEYFLSDAAQQQPAPPLKQTREAFYDRLRRAFEYLDGVVRDGRIGAYGVSSNGCVLPPDDPEATSVTRMHDAAGGRMAVLQLPYNLLERGALLTPNTPDGTALQAAVQRGLGVLVNRPLNAAGPSGHLVRLADPPRPGEPTSGEALRARLGTLAEREVTLGEAFPGTHPPRAAELLEHHWNELESADGFGFYVRNDLVADVRRGLFDVLASVDRQPSPPQARELQGYQDELNGLLGRLQARLHEPDRRPAAAIRATLEPLLPPELRAESLSRLALDFVVSTPGVTCALNGMRDPAYVADAVGVMTLPPIPNLAAVARAIG